MQAMDSEGLKDPDLAGPLLFCLLFGGILLLVSSLSVISLEEGTKTYDVTVDYCLLDNEDMDMARLQG